MLVIKPVRDRDESLVPPLVARLVAPEEQNRTAAGIESVKHPLGASGVLDDQFLHVEMLRASGKICTLPWPCILLGTTTANSIAPFVSSRQWPLESPITSGQSQNFWRPQHDVL
jgi:hypothetical protein